MNETLTPTSTSTSTSAVDEKPTGSTYNEPMDEEFKKLEIITNPNSKNFDVGNDDQLFINEISNNVILKTEGEEMVIKDYDNEIVSSKASPLSSPTSLSSIINNVVEELICEEDNIRNSQEENISDSDEDDDDRVDDQDDNDSNDAVHGVTKKLEEIDITKEESLVDDDIDKCDTDDYDTNNNDDNDWGNDLQSNAAFEMSKVFEGSNELMMLALKREHSNQEEDMLSSDDDEDDHNFDNNCVLMNDYDGTFPTKKIIEHNLDVVNEDDDDESDDYSDGDCQEDNDKSFDTNEINDDDNEVDDKENMPYEGALTKPPLPSNVNTKTIVNKSPMLNTNNSSSFTPQTQSNKVLPPQSPSIMTFPAILQMWEDRATSASSTTNILDCLNDSFLSHPNSVSIHNNTDNGALNNDVSLLTVDHNNDESFNNDDEVMIMPDADKIVALEFIDDKPLQADFELDCDDDSNQNNDDDDTATANTNDDASQHDNNNNSPITKSKALAINTPPPSSTKKERSFLRFRRHSNTDDSNNSSSKKLFSPLRAHSQAQVNHSPMPSATTTPTKQSYQTPTVDKIICSGTISTRLSLKTLLTKKWHVDNYYIQYGPTCIIIFRNHDDFHNWLHNPYLDKKQRDYLVRFYVDFYEEMESNKGIRGFKLTDIKAKSYKKGSPVMYNFKLEKWTDLGQSLYGAFACTEKYNIEHFYSILSNCLYKCPDHGLRSISDLLVS